MILNAEFNKEYSAASDFMKMNYPFAMENDEGLSYMILLRLH